MDTFDHRTELGQRAIFAEAKIQKFMKQAFAFLFFTSFLCGLGVSASERPNVVLILADDLGWSGLGCYGSTFYETPNIDRLASEGVRFTAAYSAASNCAPSRASIMSGQYTPSHGILYVGPGTYQERYKEYNGNLKKFRMLQPRGKTELPPVDQVETMAECLRENNYRTAFFGKWHLGMGKNHPGNRGFDVAIESHGKHFGFKTTPEIEPTEGQYLSDFFSDQAANFIRESSKGNAPFFLYYADFLVHKPLEAKQALLDYFGKKAFGEYQKSPVGAAMIKSLDDSVGKILAAIDDANVKDNTLVIFTSDNGGLAYEEDGIRDVNTSNFPLRGRKGSVYEGGYRVPWIVSWPGQMSRGRVVDGPVHQVDLYPTIIAATGTKRPPQELDGMNLLPLFRDQETNLERPIYWYLPGYSAFHEPSVIIRKEGWKLIESLEDGSPQLFHLPSDIAETIDLSSKNPELVFELSALANLWLDETEAPRMTPNPEFDD